VNKLLGILALALAFALTLGSVGCTKPKDEDKKEADKKEADKKDKKDADKVADKKDKKDADKVADKKDKKDTDPKEDAKLKVKASEGEITLAKKGKTTLTVELDEAAPQELSLKAWAKDVKADVLTGEGKIEKGKKNRHR
jgi:hypothetical protein